jgi:nucleoside-diphosphate-sugar epimerase
MNVLSLNPKPLSTSPPCYAGESVGQPAPYFETNVAGTIHLYVMLAHGVKKMVFSSRRATYGIPARHDPHNYRDISRSLYSLYNRFNGRSFTCHAA